ncbi:hypothetical protein [Stenotrophomonas phage c9-N]|nr:hypothetical protein [Stenotrophomonas phage c9-N]
MEAGDKVVCTGTRGYDLTAGQEYVIIEYVPAIHSENFIWPAMVVVLDDYGKMIECHARRFKEVA